MGNSRWCRSFAALLLPILVGSTALAFASEAAPAPAATDAATAEAMSLYATGRREFNLGNYEEALALFERAYKAKPVYRLLYNIAHCHRLLGHLEQARRVYKAFILESPANEPNLGVAKEKLAEVERTLAAQVRVQKSPPSGLAGVEGGQPQGGAPQRAESAPAAPRPGEAAAAAPEGLPPPSAAAAPAAGAAPQETPLAVAAPPPPAAIAPSPAPLPAPAKAAPAAPVAAVAAVHPPPVAARPLSRTLAWVSAGVGAAALVGGGVSVLLAKGTADDISGRVHDRAELKDLNSKLATQNAAATALLVAGGGLLAAATALYVVRF